MTYHYRPHGVCSKEIIVDLNEQGIIERVDFINGCPGNLIGIGKLVQGQKADILPGSADLRAGRGTGQFLTLQRPCRKERNETK